ncbi:MAG: hypothetical protein IPJ34_23150 [Myxococcales bacterium]|nr:hypothetical protein [Myxococcales bacterium]
MPSGRGSIESCGDSPACPTYLRAGHRSLPLEDEALDVAEAGERPHGRRESPDPRAAEDGAVVLEGVEIEVEADPVERDVRDVAEHHGALAVDGVLVGVELGREHVADDAVGLGGHRRPALRRRVHDRGRLGHHRGGRERADARDDAEHAEAEEPHGLEHVSLRPTGVAHREGRD